MGKILKSIALFFAVFIAVLFIIELFVLELKVKILAFILVLLVNGFAATMLYRNKTRHYIIMSSALIFLCLFYLISLPNRITCGAHVLYQEIISAILLIPIPVIFIITKLINHIIAERKNRME